jgi:hypothetical protein
MLPPPFDGEMLGARLRGFDRDFLLLAIGARAEKVVLGEVRTTTFIPSGITTPALSICRTTASSR